MTRITVDGAHHATPVEVIVQRSVRAHDGAERGIPVLCMSVRRVRLLHHYESRDGRHRLYIFEAPDAELVRELARMAWPDDDLVIWSALARAE